MESFLTNLRLADILDITFVALFFFVVIGWVRKSATNSTARRLIVTISIFSLFFLFARSFEMYLFERVIQIVLLLLLFSSVIIFQHDIRRLLDRIATWRMFRNDQEGFPAEAHVDVIVEAVSRLAEQHTGALIALKGREPWDNFVQGGVELGGQVSLPLLYSIFDTRTPGHDGAVLLEAGCVTRFAVHLPLTIHNPEESRFGGTRHAAATGLSELCDAFVIVVSEERGTISVARNGALSHPASISEFKGQLLRFWKTIYSGDEYKNDRWGSIRGLQNAGISVVLASILWLLFAYSPNTVLRTVAVPIEYKNLPGEWDLVDPVPMEANVVLNGSEQAIRTLNTSDLVISIDMSNPASGLRRFRIDRSDLNLPPGVNLERVEPQELNVRLRQLERIVLPVQARSTGSLPDTLRLVRLVSIPDSVTLFVPSSNRNRYHRIRTDPVDLSDLRQTSIISVGLDLPDGARLPMSTHEEVAVRVEVASKQR